MYKRKLSFTYFFLVFAAILAVDILFVLAQPTCEPGYEWQRLSGVGCVQKDCGKIPNAHYSYEGYCICGSAGSKAENPNDPNKRCTYRPSDPEYKSCPNCIYACVHLDELCPREKKTEEKGTEQADETKKGDCNEDCSRIDHSIWDEKSDWPECSCICEKGYLMTQDGCKPCEEICQEMDKRAYYDDKTSKPNDCGCYCRGKFLEFSWGVESGECKCVTGAEPSGAECRCKVGFEPSSDGKKCIPIEPSPERKIECDTTPPTCPTAGSAPSLRNPGIPSGSLCRNACGGDCPSTCTREPDKTISLPDSTGKCYYNCEYKNVIKCGSHQGCRDHDACYDRCALRLLPGVICRRYCDAICLERWGVSNCSSWALGGGPFDSYIAFSNRPVITGPYEGNPSSDTVYPDDI